jgi:hypothetical protein
VELTTSYEDVFTERVLARYELAETRKAAAVLAATNPPEMAELADVLNRFVLSTEDLVSPGGNEAHVPKRLNEAFRARGWREAGVDTRITLALRIMPYAPAGETTPQVTENQVANEGYKVDNVKARVALDVEWNAKDGNLDRDIAAYRALHEQGMIDAAVILTRTHDDLKTLAYRLSRQAGLGEAAAKARFSTTTTTNLTKLAPRLTRGDAGGCPLLCVAISPRCWAGHPRGGLSLLPEAHSEARLF